MSPKQFIRPRNFSLEMLDMYNPKEGRDRIAAIPLIGNIQHPHPQNPILVVPSGDGRPLVVRPKSVPRDRCSDMSD